ncbi:hypothetical protein [Roseisolibacter agri]|uniref:BIG2 domain-containing protein n=1 Tax=Roseisolibacter agri TaxID=2014610 RepID=A0AA37QHK7_9BACT|nr:hypothetical protein [Roseisolibacter agri]GLC25913.1 hypothetical protein rosag_24260 [Roseisolibacter agri]
MRPIRSITLAAFCALLGCSEAEPPFTPFGPGMLTDPLSVRLAVGDTARVRATWAANTPEPKLRVSWTIDRRSVVVVESVAPDTRSVRLRALSAGTATMTVIDSASQSVVSVPITIQ